MTKPAIQKQLETRGGLLALMAVIRRQLLRELDETKTLESSPHNTPTTKGVLSRRRIEIQASLSFVQETEPHAAKLADQLAKLTHPHLFGGDKW